MSRLYWLTINGAVLTICAVLIYERRSAVLMTAMLFLPFLDRQWQFPIQNIIGDNRWLVLSVLITLGLAVYSEVYHLPYSPIGEVVFLAALPEEWFFRAYLTTSLVAILKNKNIAILVTSLLFAFLHLPTQGTEGLLVFFPSLVFCWVYLRTNSLFLVISIHTAANIMYYQCVSF